MQDDTCFSSRVHNMFQTRDQIMAKKVANSFETAVINLYQFHLYKPNEKFSAIVQLLEFKKTITTWFTSTLQFYKWEPPRIYHFKLVIYLSSLAKLKKNLNHVHFVTLAKAIGQMTNRFLLFNDIIGRTDCIFEFAEIAAEAIETKAGTDQTEAILETLR